MISDQIALQLQFNYHYKSHRIKIALELFLEYHPLGTGSAKG